MCVHLEANRVMARFKLMCETTSLRPFSIFPPSYPAPFIYTPGLLVLLTQTRSPDEKVNVFLLRRSRFPIQISDYLRFKCLSQAFLRGSTKPARTTVDLTSLNRLVFLPFSVTGQAFCLQVFDDVISACQQELSQRPLDRR